jgi:hypothetical protein
MLLRCCDIAPLFVVDFVLHQGAEFIGMSEEQQEPCRESHDVFRRGKGKGGKEKRSSDHNSRFFRLFGVVRLIDDRQSDDRIIPFGTGAGLHAKEYEHR